MSLTITPVASTGTSPATTQQSPSFKGGVTSEVVDEFIKRGNPVKTWAARNFTRIVVGLTGGETVVETAANIPGAIHNLVNGHGLIQAHSFLGGPAVYAGGCAVIAGVCAKLGSMYNKVGAKKALEFARELKAGGADENKIRIALDDYFCNTRTLLSGIIQRRSVAVQNIMDKLNGSATA